MLFHVQDGLGEPSPHTAADFLMRTRLIKTERKWSKNKKEIVWVTYLDICFAQDKPNKMLSASCSKKHYVARSPESEFHPHPVLR